ncbi:MAG: HAD-IA family hydrolase [Vicinamibacteria bacterium]|nr:HAD-IA family hydrolase [Vicinamibacteria bacterium]
MQKLETLFIDAGGVLVFPNWARVSAALAARGIDLSPVALAAADHHARRELDAPAAVAGTNDAQRGWLYFNLVLKHAGQPLTEATDAALAELKAYHAEHNLWELVADGAPEALRRLRARGLKLVVVSNANGKLRSLMDRLGLAPLVDVMLDSHEEGVEKPDPRLFARALERSGARAESTLHVGDLYHVDVVGARRAGLRAALIDGGGLYADADCPRFTDLKALAAAL